MPYSTNADLPDSVRGVLPEGAQTIFRKAFNAAYETYHGDETRAVRVAWAAVKKVYKKGDDDMWVKLEMLSGKLAIARAYAQIDSQ